MSEHDQIKQMVSQLQRKRRLQLVLDYLMRGLFWGAIPAGLLILVSRLFIMPINEYWFALGLLGTLTLAFIVLGIARRLTTISIANDMDAVLGFKERVSSAIALGDNGSAKDPFVKTLIQDTARRIDELELKHVYPWRLPPTWRYALPALVLAAAMSFVPQLNLLASPEAEEEYQQIKETGRELQELAEKTEKELEENRDPVLREHTEEIKRTGEKLEKNRMRKKEALKELQRLKDKLQMQAREDMPAGEKKLVDELAENLKQLETTEELGRLMEEMQLDKLQAELNELAMQLSEGKMNEQQAQFMDDMIKALEQTLQSQAASDPEAQALKQQLEEMKQTLQENKQLQKQLQSAADELEKDVNKLAESMKQNQMGQQGQQLQQQMQQLMEQLKQDGVMDPDSLQQMKESLESAQQNIQQNQSLSESQKQQLSQLAQEALQNFQSSDPNCQGGECGQMGNLNNKMQQGNQKLGQQMQGMGSQLGQGQGQMSGLSQQLLKQIEQMKRNLAYGNSLGSGGQANSGWGMGTSPYATTPAPADPNNQVENRQSDETRDTDTIDFDPMYAPEDFAHGFSSENDLQGNFDLSGLPEKIEELRTKPETQEARAEFAEVFGTYIEGEESSINREEIPLEYQEMVRNYFSTISQGSAGTGSTDGEGAASEDEGEDEAADTGDEDSE
jgi:hypothetical protein